MQEVRKKPRRRSIAKLRIYRFYSVKILPLIYATPLQSNFERTRSMKLSNNLSKNLWINRNGLIRLSFDKNVVLIRY